MTMLAFHHRGKHKEHWWEARCDCGNVKVVVAGSDTRSCGCLQPEVARRLGGRNKTHGMRHTPEYRSWCNMRNRCYNQNVPAFKDYGGRGITVCERWRLLFVAFFADMGQKPPGKYGVERIDNERGYEPDNCKWATPQEQASNRRRQKPPSHYRGQPIKKRRHVLRSL